MFLRQNSMHLRPVSTRNIEQSGDLSRVILVNLVVKKSSGLPARTRSRQNPGTENQTTPDSPASNPEKPYAHTGTVTGGTTLSKPLTSNPYPFKTSPTRLPSTKILWKPSKPKNKQIRDCSITLMTNYGLLPKLVLKSKLMQTFICIFPT